MMWQQNPVTRLAPLMVLSSLLFATGTAQAMAGIPEPTQALHGVVDTAYEHAYPTHDRVEEAAQKSEGIAHGAVDPAGGVKDGAHDGAGSAHGLAREQLAQSAWLRRTLDPAQEHVSATLEALTTWIDTSRSTV